MIKDVMERDMINEISTLFVMIFTSGLMFVMPILYIGYNDILVIIGFGILLSFMLTIIPILLSYDIRDEIIELIGDMDSQIVVDTSVYKKRLHLRDDVAIDMSWHLFEYHQTFTVPTTSTNSPTLF